MNWQSTYLIESEVPIEKGKYNCEGEDILIFEIADSPNEEFKNTKRILRAINRTVSFDNILDAHIFLENTTKQFLSKVAFIGYCRANMIQHFSTTLETGQYGRPFDVLVTHVLMSKKYAEKITPQDMEYSLDNLDEIKRFYFQNITTALQADSLEERILLLYTAIETYVEGLSEEIINKCPQCEYTWSSGRRKTLNKIRGLLKEGGVKKEEINEFIKSRQIIAHGSKKIKTAKYFSRLKEVLSSIQHVFFEIAENFFEVDFINTEMPMVDNPYAIYKVECDEGGSCKVNPDRFSGTASVSLLFNSDDNAKRILTFSYGLYTGESIKRSIPIDDSNKVLLYFPSVFEFDIKA